MAIKLNGSTSGSVALDAPADTSPSGTDVTLTLPTSAGSSGQYLQTNGSGTLSWQTVTTGKILQVVQTYKRDTFSTSTNGSHDLLTRTITPVAAGSSFLLMGKLMVGSGASQSTGFAFRWLLGTTHITDGSGTNPGDRNIGWSGSEEGISDNTYGQYQTYDYSSQYIHTPTYTLGDTLTYKIGLEVVQAVNFYLNRTSYDGTTGAYPRGTSNLTIMEIAA